LLTLLAGAFVMWRGTRHFGDFCQRVSLSVRARHRCPSMARGCVAPTSGYFLRSSAHRDDCSRDVADGRCREAFVRVAPDLEALLGQMCVFVTWLVGKPVTAAALTVSAL
jgi:hypothetical protein